MWLAVAREISIRKVTCLSRARDASEFCDKKSHPHFTIHARHASHTVKHSSIAALIDTLAI